MPTRNEYAEYGTRNGLPPSIRNWPLPHPRAIKQELDKHVIEQNPAKVQLSVAARNHYAQLRYLDSSPGPDLIKFSKMNVLLMGPTGSGKTLLARTLAAAMGVPYAIVDATKMTEAGYVGQDVETMLQVLLARADGNVELAQRGVIYVDEVDKLMRKSENTSITRDVSGEGVQQGMLTLLGGAKVLVPTKGGRVHPQGDNIEIDTSNILFILGGAFVGLDRIVAHRMADKGASIGFNAEVRSKETELDTYQLLQQVTDTDLVKFGLIPEFVGRLPVRVVVHQLDVAALKKILVEPQNSLIRQAKAMAAGDVWLEFSDAALTAIAEEAAASATGARALERIVSETLLPIQFSLPDGRVVVTPEMVRDRKLHLERLAKDVTYLSTKCKAA
jgi:ATP-dependent Clp protease ATP-binding subunit ClpX